MDQTFKKESDLTYLVDALGGKKHLIREVIDVFLKHVPEDIIRMNNAVALEDYRGIKNMAHTMTSSASIMGISSLAPILTAIEDLAKGRSEMIEILKLKIQADLIWTQAIDEISSARRMYL